MDKKINRAGFWREVLANKLNAKKSKSTAQMTYWQQKKSEIYITCDSMCSWSYFFYLLFFYKSTFLKKKIEFEWFPWSLEIFVIFFFVVAWRRTHVRKKSDQLIDFEWDFLLSEDFECKCYQFSSITASAQSKPENIVAAHLGHLTAHLFVREALPPTTLGITGLKLYQ